MQFFLIEPVNCFEKLMESICLEYIYTRGSRAIAQLLYDVEKGLRSYDYYTITL